MNYDKFIQDNEIDVYQLFKTIIHNREAVVYFKDRESRIQYVNDRFFTKHKQFEDNKEAVVGKTDFDLFEGNDHAKEAYDAEQEIMRTGKSIHVIEHEGINERGNAIIAYTQKYPVYNSMGDIIGIFGISEDMTAGFEALLTVDHENDKLMKLNQKLTKENTTDILSGIHNRRFLNAELELLFSQYQKDHIPFCILSIDVDNFKHINDHYGHEIGDMVIRFIGSSLLKFETIYYPEIKVCRQGGDEFMIIMPYIKKEIGLEIANHIRKLFMNETFMFEDFHETITMSMGLSEIRNNDTIKSLLQRVDHRLYIVKNHHKNGICYKGDKDDKNSHE